MTVEEEDYIHNDERWRLEEDPDFVIITLAKQTLMSTVIENSLMITLPEHI